MKINTNYFWVSKNRPNRVIRVLYEKIRTSVDSKIKL